MAAWLVWTAYTIAAGLLGAYLYELTPVGVWVDHKLRWTPSGADGSGRSGSLSEDTVSPEVSSVEQLVLAAELFDAVDWSGWDEI